MHRAWAAIWASLSPLGHLIGQPTGLLGVQWWKLSQNLIYSIHVCFLLHAKSLGFWDLPRLVQALCLGRNSAFIQPVAKELENQKSL